MNTNKSSLQFARKSKFNQAPLFLNGQMRNQFKIFYIQTQKKTSITAIII